MTTTLALYVRPSRCPARTTAQHLRMFFRCTRYGAEELVNARAYKTERMRDFSLSEAAHFYARAGFHLDRAVIPPR